FRQEGFRGDAESYDGPANSSIVHVLETRRGMPITLSIVVVEVARRAGIAMNGIGLPGHFIVGGPDLPPGQYLDPFDGGDVMDAAGGRQRGGRGFDTPPGRPEEAVLPASARAVLLRLLPTPRRPREERG